MLDQDVGDFILKVLFSRAAEIYISRQSENEAPSILGKDIFALILSKRRKSMAASDRSGHPVRRAPRIVYIWPRFRVEFWFTGLKEYGRR